MKTLIFASILSILYACNFTEPETTTTTTEQPNTPKKITTLVYEYDYNSKTVLYSGSAPDTVFPAYIQPQPKYTKVDSIWGFYFISQNDWQVRINDGQPSHFNVKGSHWYHRFIKRWEK